MYIGRITFPSFLSFFLSFFLSVFLVSFLYWFISFCLVVKGMMVKRGSHDTWTSPATLHEKERTKDGKKKKDRHFERMKGQETERRKKEEGKKRERKTERKKKTEKIILCQQDLIVSHIYHWDWYCANRILSKNGQTNSNYLKATPYIQLSIYVSEIHQTLHSSANYHFCKKK